MDDVTDRLCHRQENVYDIPKCDWINSVLSLHCLFQHSDKRKQCMTYVATDGMLKSRLGSDPTDPSGSAVTDLILGDQ